MSQFGEIEDIHLVREEDTGKSRGFGFVKYEDARSCVLAVDNFVGTQVLGRSIRVDHVEHYRLPKKLQEQEEELQRKQYAAAGHAYEGKELENKYNVSKGVDLFAPASPGEDSDSHDDDNKVDKEARKRRQEERRRKRQKKEERRREREMKRERKEEKKRRKRAHHHDEREKENSSDDNDEEKSSHEYKKQKHNKKKRKHDKER
jgi:RNA-binding motif X-linked protein 2